MAEPTILDRINELARKSKVEELTAEEKKEQIELRAQYVSIFRANLRGMLDNTHIEELDGTIHPLKKKNVQKTYS